MTDDWLADVVLLNDNRDEATPGDVSVYRTADDACSGLEHWWVENGEGFAFTATGQRLTLGVDERGRVIVVGQETTPDGPDIVRAWLRAYASGVLETRRIKAARGKIFLSRSEKQGHLPTSIEGLIAYVGFEN